MESQNGMNDHLQFLQLNRPWDIQYWKKQLSSGLFHFCPRSFSFRNKAGFSCMKITLDIVTHDFKRGLPAYFPCVTSTDHMVKNTRDDFSVTTLIKGLIDLYLLAGPCSWPALSHYPDATDIYSFINVKAFQVKCPL